MPTQLIYILATNAVTPNFWGNTQIGGSPPTAATTAYGWGPAKTALPAYWRARLGATTTSSDAASTTSTNAAATGPRVGTGTGAATAGDCFIAGPFTGVFDNVANWSLLFNLRATTAGCVGRLGVRLWRGANANGSGATQICANTQGILVTLSTSADVAANVTLVTTSFPGAMTFNNEYLFFQIEWQETTQGSSNNDNVFFRTGAAWTTCNFIPAVTGTLNVSQQNHTIQAQGTSPVVGRLALTETPDALAGAGNVPVVGRLTLTETPDALAGAGTVSGGLPPITGGVGAGAAPDINTSLLVHADGTNGSTTFTDAGANSLTVTASNGAQVTTAAAKFGTGAANFTTNTAGVITCGDGTSFEFYTNPFTVEAWAYFTSAPGTVDYHAIASEWSGSAGGASWYFGTDNSGNLLMLGTTDGNTAYFSLSGAFTPTLNTWYHLAVDRDASQYMRLYVNGSVIATRYTGEGYWVAPTYPCTIGNQSSGAGVAFPGYLDEIRVSTGIARYGGAFTPATLPFGGGVLAQDAQTLQAAGTVATPLPPINGSLGPSVPAYTVLLLHFDGPNNSTTFTDDSFSAHPLTSVAGAFNSAGTTMFGSPGALFLPGGASSVSAGVSEDFHFGAGPFTIEAWCMFFSNAVDIIATQGDLDNPAGNLGWSFFTNSGNLGFAFTTNGTNFGAAYAAFTPTLYTWYHLAVDRDATNTLRIYINGVVGTSSPSFTYTIYPSARNTLIGNDAISSNYVFKGYLDEIRITKGLAQYGGAFTPPAQAFLPDFPISGLTQANQTLSAAGTVGSPAITGTLAITEAPDGLTATGRVIVGGTLTQPQAPQTIAGIARIVVGGALNVTEALDTIAGLGRVVVGATLSATEALDTIVGLARTTIGGTLSQPQASQTIVAAGGPVADATSSYWSASDAAATGYYALSNGGLTFTYIGVNGYLTNLRATMPRSTGKYYFEFYANSTGGNIGFGVTNAASNPGHQIGQTPEGGAFYYSQTTASAAFTPNYSSFLWPSPGYTVGMAVDFTNGGVWFALNNAWLNSSNPATNTLPMLSFDPAVTGPLYPTAGPGQTTDIWTIQSIYASQTYAPPAGFMAWDDQAVGPTITGTLAITETPDGVVATGTVTVRGTLAAPQAPQTIAGSAGVAVTGTLSATEALDTIVGHAGPVAGGTLALTEALDTITGHAGVSVTGTLTQPQAPHSLIAAAGATVGGALTATQGSQGVQATGTVTVRGTLAVPQAAQTLIGFGSVLSGVGGGLAETQDPQTLQGAVYATPVIVGTLNLSQAPQALVAGGGPVVTSHLAASQDAQTLTGHAGPVAGLTLTATQAPQTLAGLANGAVMGHLVATQVDQGFTGRATLTVGAVLALLQDSEIITARGHSDVAAALHLTQAAQRLSASGTTGYVQTRALLMA